MTRLKEIPEHLKGQIPNIQPEKRSTLDTYHNSMSHEELQNSVIQRAHSLGWKVAGFRKAQYIDGSWSTPVLADGEGWPDLFLVHEEQMRKMVIEIKTAKDTVKPAQERWLNLLVGVGIEVYVIRPKDWHSGLVDRILEDVDVRIIKG